MAKPAARGEAFRGRLIAAALLSVAFLAGSLTSTRQQSGSSSGESCQQAAPGSELTWLASVEELKQPLGAAIKRLRRGEARLLYYHVPKSGGSSMCNAMVQAKMPLMGCIENFKDQVVVHPTNVGCNCNGYLDGKHSIFATGSPEEVLEYIKDRRPRAFFDEDGLPDQPYFGPQVVHAIVVRHPVRRFVSHVMHVVAEADKTPLDEVDVNEEVVRVLNTGRSRTKKVYIPDNFLTRYLGGFKKKTAKQITFEHFQAALHNLERMQVVLVLEESSSAAQLLEAVGLQPFGSKSRFGTNASQVVGSDLSPEVQQRLDALHQWDLLLYDWCVQRHHRSVEAFSQLQLR